MATFLSDFQIIRPRYEAKQEDLLRWLALAHAFAEKEEKNSAFHQEIEKRFFKVGLGDGKIEKRSCQLRDFFHERWEEMKIFLLNSDQTGKKLTERGRLFEEEIYSLFSSFYPAGAKIAPHLIHVTCTGYVSPSGAQKIVAERGYGAKSVVTHAYHMGCYAAIPALRIASGLLSPLASPSVDIVHTEFCSLHMNPSLHDTEQLVVQSLFADGFIKYSINKKRGPLQILALHEEIIPGSSEAMTWRMEEWGMRMTIAKEVPVLIARALPDFLQRLLPNRTLQKEALFAIHPGGPKIISQVGEILKLEEEQLAHSRKILQSCGNMSSATLPHIWESMVKDKKVKSGTQIVSLAFGPGLTVAGALFQKRKEIRRER